MLTIKVCADSKYRTGDLIPEAKTEEEWIMAINQRKPVWCIYENSSTNGKYYGKLYNIYAINDLRGLSPIGFHIPTERDWNLLIEASGGKENAGRVLKNSEGWCNNGNGAINSIFKGKPGGFRSESGEFINKNCGAYWWTKDSKIVFLNWSTNKVEKNNGLTGGYSV